MTRTLDIAEAAAELGRSRDWLYANWRQLIRDRQMPAPLHPDPPYTWSRAQFYAWLDRPLSRDQRALAAAHRAAYDAAITAKHASDDALTVDDWHGKLRSAFGGHR